jgi:hypothetical protein
MYPSFAKSVKDRASSRDDPGKEFSRFSEPFRIAIIGEQARQDSRGRLSPPSYFF